MKLIRAIPLWIVFVVLSSTIVCAEVVGKWVSTDKNSCSCSISLVIERGPDGSLTGTMTFPGAQKNIYSTTPNGDGISFLVDQPDNDASVTYKYDASVDGDTMTGKWASKDDPSQTKDFSATRAAQ
jgi:hypothetical protein